MANEAIRVKALEWNAATSFFYAKSPFGPYRVQDCWHWEDKSIAYTSIFAETVIGDFLSLEEAKAACQADFARRVGECVEGEGEPGNENMLTLRDADEIEDRLDALRSVAEGGK